MKIKLEQYSSSEDLLICPSCGETTLHHGKVEVFSRDGEDSQTGRHVVVESNGWVNTDNSMGRNPSLRRDGILIHFWCECCADKSVLSIAQHKGATLIASGIVSETIRYDAKS